MDGNGTVTGIRTSLEIIQGDSEEKVNILGSESTGHIGKKFTNMCLVLSGYRERTF